MSDAGHRGTTADADGRLASTVDSLCPPGRLTSGLPADAAARVALIDAMTAPHRAARVDAFAVTDDGRLVTVEVLLEQDDDALHAELLDLGGDVRCLDRDGAPLLQIRFFRDGRRSAADVIVGPGDAWPASQSDVGVDFHGAGDCSVRRMATLLDLAATAADFGRDVYFLNLPPHLRLFAEACGQRHLVPIKRDRVGPHLPEVLSDLRR